MGYRFGPDYPDETYVPHAYAEHSRADDAPFPRAGPGQRHEYRSHPAMGHSMHGQDPDLYARVVSDWVATLP